MKIFVASDIHSYFSIFKQALDNAGYDYENKDHMLILCGDCFDRGDESQEVLDFLNSHTERTIITFGNHRDLTWDMLDRGYYENHDVHNQTPKTVLNLAGYKDVVVTRWGIEGFTPEKWEDACEIAREKLTPLDKRCVNYYETKNYIFTHSWIPTKRVVDEENFIQGAPPEYQPHKTVYDPDWRNAAPWIWSEEARWCNPFKMAHLGLNQTGKTIVFGHWHTSHQYAIDKWHEMEKKFDEWIDFDELEWGKQACFDIYRGEDYIGIDACTAHSGQVNILVLEDELLEEEIND